jgi:hypothetical protein
MGGCRLTSQLAVGHTQISGEWSACQKVRPKLNWWSEPRLNGSIT